MTTKLKTWPKYRDKKKWSPKKKKKIQISLVTFDNVRQNEPLKGEHVSWDELWQKLGQRKVTSLASAMVIMMSTKSLRWISCHVAFSKYFEVVATSACSLSLSLFEKIHASYAMNYTQKDKETQSLSHNVEL